MGAVKWPHSPLFQILILTWQARLVDSQWDLVSILHLYNLIFTLSLQREFPLPCPENEAVFWHSFLLALRLPKISLLSVSVLNGKLGLYLCFNSKKDVLWRSPILPTNTWGTVDRRRSIESYKSKRGRIKLGFGSVLLGWFDRHVERAELISDWVEIHQRIAPTEWLLLGKWWARQFLLARLHWSD